MHRLFSSFSKKVLLFFLLAYSSNLLGQQISLGLGYYNLSPPTGAATPQLANGNPAYPSVSPSFNQAVQSNDWWSSLIYKYTQNQTFNWEIQSWKLYAHPLAGLATRYGLDLRYPDTASVSNYHGLANAKYQHALDIKDLSIGIEGMDLGLTDTTKVEAYGDWHVKTVWDDGNGHELKATMAHGSPFVFFEKNSTDSLYVRFFFGHSIDNTIGTNVIGITTQGHHYGIFAPMGSSWNTNAIIEHDGNNFVSGSPSPEFRPAFKSDLNGQNYFSIAVLPDNSLTTLQNFANHAFAFIEDTAVTWAYDETTAVLETTFNTTCVAKEGTNTQTLQALYRHQWLNSTAINTPYLYASARGTMKVVQGNTFSTTLKNTGILPALPLALSAQDSSTLYQYIDDEFQVTNTYITQNDTYWQGKRMGRQADLIQIAHQVGHTAARDKFIADLKFELEDWFKADDGETDRGYFYYDNTWHTLIGYPASFGSDTHITDHHFHYAYFIKAASTIAQFDPTWANTSNWGNMVNLLIKDVNNWDKNDPQFPFLRYFDAYAGHSWANGDASSHWGNDQEASSEAMNFAAHTYFWGLNNNDTTLRDLGLYLYLTEASAIEQYWFDKDNAVFPTAYPYATATRIWGNGADKIVGSEPWEQESEYQLGINTIPVHAPLLYLAKSVSMMETAYLEAANLGNGIGQEWDDVMWSIQAMFDPATALQDFKTHTAPIAYHTNAPWLPHVNGIYEDFSDFSYAPAHLYHWLHNLDSLGQVNPNICADYSSTLVFTKGNIQHYAIYNPSTNPITVTFSDGLVIPVPSDTLYLYKKDNNICDVNNIDIIDSPTVSNLHQAGQIQSNGPVTVDTDATFKAGFSIELNPAFCVPLGSSFLGFIENCTNLIPPEINNE